MRTTLITTLFGVAGLVLPCARAPQGEAGNWTTKQFSVP
jgi:hypothetical protein